MQNLADRLRFEHCVKCVVWASGFCAYTNYLQIRHANLETVPPFQAVNKANHGTTKIFRNDSESGHFVQRGQPGNSQRFCLTLSGCQQLRKVKGSVLCPRFGSKPEAKNQCEAPWCPIHLSFLPTIPEDISFKDTVCRKELLELSFSCRSADLSRRSKMHRQWIRASHCTATKL